MLACRQAAIYQTEFDEAEYYPLSQREVDFHFQHIDLPQNADTAVQMRKDILRFGSRPSMNHRVYTRQLEPSAGGGGTGARCRA